MSAPRRDYARDEMAVRGAWYASGGETPAQTETEIAKRAAVEPRIALRVWLLRRAGTPRVLDYWLTGCLTLRQVERIVLAAAFDEETQLSEACAQSAIIRAREARSA